MVRQRTIGLVVAALASALAIARATTGTEDSETLDPRLERARRVLAGQSEPRVKHVQDMINEKTANTGSGLLSGYTIRAGVYIDNITSDSTIALEWRQD